MAYLAVNPDGREYIFHNNPSRVICNYNDFYSYWKDKGTYDYIRGMTTSAEDFSILLPKGSIKKLIGRDLTWEDEPVVLKYNY